jgi:hypothetical protein
LPHVRRSAAFAAAESSFIAKGSFISCRRRPLGNAMRMSWMRQRRTSQSEAATEARNVFEFLMRRKTLIHPY